MSNATELLKWALRWIPRFDEDSIDLRNAIKYYLYAHPDEPAKKPLNGDEILEAFNSTGFTNTDYRLRCFTEGVRFAENKHGISKEP